MKHNIDTVLFDFDGTLVNTNPLIIKTFEETLKHYLPERVFTREMILDFIGPTLKQTFDSLLKDKTLEMIEYYRTLNLKMHDEMVTIYPSVKEGLELLHQNNIKLGIVSSKKRDLINRGLKLFNLEQYFDVIIGVEEVIKHKPDPEGIYLAMEKLNCQKDNVIFVGDNSHDIEGGHNAGVITCAVSWAERGALYLKQYNPDYILEDMRDLLKIIRGENNE